MREMPLDAKLRQRLEQTLGATDESNAPARRLRDDAMRLWRRVRFFIALGLVATDGLDRDGLELCCYAIQLPQRRVHPSGKPTRVNLRERIEHAVEMLIMAVGEEIDEFLLDRATRILVETPQRSPMLDEARLLADALSLEDFGVTGLLQQMTQLLRQGDGIDQLAQGCEQREAYGYWDARLKDGFHFDTVRDLARRRLDNARLTCSLLMEETAMETPPEDLPGTTGEA